jgi:hypothetical protein
VRAWRAGSRRTADAGISAATRRRQATTRGCPWACCHVCRQELSPGAQPREGGAHRDDDDLSRLINELGTARMVATRSVTATRPALAGAARPAGCRMARTQRHDPSRQELALATIKAVHTAAWFSIESCVLYVIYSGFKGRSDRRAAIAAGVVAAETLVFAGNGLRCPLTDVAEHLGAEQASVTDLYLPRWFADNLPAIHVPLILLAAFLHERNVRRARGAVSADPAGGGRRAGARHRAISGTGQTGARSRA